MSLRGRPTHKAQEVEARYSPDQLIDLITKNEASLDVETLLFNIIEEIGGIKSFGRMVGRLLKKRSTDATSKMKIVAMVSDLTKVYTARREKNAADPKDMNDDDLRRVAKALLTKVGVQE